MPKIVLISGKAEHGKTTVANFIKEGLIDRDFNAVGLPYGQYVKDSAKMIFGWDGKKDEHGRSLLQFWGTDIVRKKDSMFWVNTVVRLVDVARDVLDYVIIDDCRFMNEVDTWKKYIYPNILLRVNRQNHISKLTPEQLNHPSETSMDTYGYDYLIENSSTISDLKSTVETDVIPLLLNL